jgi:hypothetical protein
MRENHLISLSSIFINIFIVSKFETIVKQINKYRSINKINKPLCIYLFVVVFVVECVYNDSLCEV